MYEVGVNFSPQKCEIGNLDNSTKSFINLQISTYAENSLKCSGFAYKDSTFYDG